MYENIIKKYFPYNTARKGQLEALFELFEAKESYSHFILDANVGYGKTAIARTLVEAMKCEENESSFILTSTKMLQEQYMIECINNKHNVNYKLAKGRSNFYCKWLQNYTLCSEGECVTKDVNEKSECIYGMFGNLPSNNGGCEYYVQKAEAIDSDVCIMNYDVLLSDKVDHYSNRHIMVCDEAHNIDNKVMQRIGITLSEPRLKKYGIKILEEDYDHYDIEYWIDKLEYFKKQLQQSILNPKYYRMNKKQVNDAKNLYEKIASRLSDIKFNKDYWFVYPNFFEHKIMIKPLDVRKYVKPYLLDRATDFHLYMSGSIVDFNNFSKYLGLDEDEFYYLKSNSTFDMSKQNPIIPKYCGQLTYKQKNKTLPLTYEVLEYILFRHRNDKGIIHCHSKEFRNRIMENVSSERLISYNNSEEKEEVIEYFEDSDDNDVIVAYSLQEGLDLPYDNIRFQVLYKVPFPFLGDPQIKARMNADKDWYMIEAIRNIIQAHGRGMRAEDDYCTNYLIDSSFQGVFKSKLCPTELKECMRRVTL